MRDKERESCDEDASAPKRERKEKEEQEKGARRSSVPRFCINPMIDRTMVYNR